MGSVNSPAFLLCATGRGGGAGSSLLDVGSRLRLRVGGFAGARDGFSSGIAFRL